MSVEIDVKAINALRMRIKGKPVDLTVKDFIRGDAPSVLFIRQKSTTILLVTEEKIMSDNCNDAMSSIH